MYHHCYFIEGDVEVQLINDFSQDTQAVSLHFE